MVIYVYVDGLAEPKNPGIGTYGFVIYKDGKKIDQGRGFAGEKVTNNFSEYTALIEALKRIRRYKEEEIIVYSDSALLVNQMKGKWKAKKGMYKGKLEEAKKIASEFKRIEFFWIPRENNKEADTLSRIAYSEYSNQDK
jgi:ribonuclease HI